MNLPKSFQSHSILDTQKLAQTLSSFAKPGQVFALYGSLGAGKTTFTNALGQTMGIPKPLKSPTFTLVRQYPLNNQQFFYHVDLYRLTTPKELDALGLFEALNQNQHLFAIEWPELISLDLAKLKQVMAGNIFIDTRNQYNPNKLRQHGFEYIGIGR